MKRRLYPIILLIVMLSCQESSIAQCYELLWSDEFDYTGFPDPEYWSFETGGDGWGNNELQYYKMNDEDNSWVENGTLKINALKENYGGRYYTSARIITRNKFNFQYGKIEAKLKLPYGQGIWPAFWIMGENISEVGWPACGEVDIMEMVGGEGRDNVIHGTAHWDNNGSHAQYGKGYSLNEGIFADSFHTFTVEWNPAAIRWFVDGNQYNVLNITSEGLSEFHGDFFILLNLAVGGIWPGNPDGTTEFPQTLEVDYVRVYKTKQQLDALEIAGEDIVPPKAADRKFSFPGSTEWIYEWLVPEDAEIIIGQGSPNVQIDWGCNNGLIKCNITGKCGIYSFEKEISVLNEIYGPMFISPGEENILFYIDSLTGSNLFWNVPFDAVITKGQGSDSIYVNWGDNFGAVELTVENSCGINTLSFLPVRAGQYSYPEIENPQRIPGIIEAVNYDYGGEGIAYHDLSGWNEGPGPRQDESVDTEYNDKGNPNVGWIRSGEWLEFTVSVDSASWYQLNMRVASANSSGGPFSVLFNNEEKLKGIRVNGTGAWDAFTTLNAGTLYLTPEDTLMRLNFETGNFNLGKMTFLPATDPTINIRDNHWNDLLVYPIPTENILMVRCEKGINKVRIVDIKGRLIYTNEFKERPEVELNIENVIPGVYFLNIHLSDKKVKQKLILKGDTK